MLSITSSLVDSHSGSVCKRPCMYMLLLHLVISKCHFSPGCTDMCREYLEPLLDLAVPVADKTGWAADDDTLSNRCATKQIIA